MTYGDELDRIPPPVGLTRRQFLSAGGGRAARVAAGVLLPGAGKRVLGPSADSTDPAADIAERREG